MPTFLEPVLSFLEPIWKDLVGYFVDSFGMEYQVAQWVVVGLGVYGIFVLFLSGFHKRMVKNMLTQVRQCVYEYDRVWYLTARAMYAYNIHMKRQGKQSPLTHWTTSVLKLKDNHYLNHKAKIFEDIKKLEQYFNQQFIPEKVLRKINFYHKKITFWNSLQLFFWWSLTVLTLGVYKLSWKKVMY